MVTNFERCFQIVVGEEGGYTTNPKDPGNWTGGKVGVGALHGTKYGISAAAFPAYDIANLTLKEAQGIYANNYWRKIHGDALPFELALPLFDAAVNEGTVTAIKQLQRALRVRSDGVWGHDTDLALSNRIGAADVDGLLADFMAAQSLYKIALRIFGIFGEGWMRREFRICIHAIRGY